MCAHRGGCCCKRWCCGAKLGSTMRVSGVTPWDSGQLQGGSLVMCLPIPPPHRTSHSLPTIHQALFVRPGAFPHPPPLNLPLFSFISQSFTSSACCYFISTFHRYKFDNVSFFSHRLCHLHCAFLILLCVALIAPAAINA